MGLRGTLMTTPAERARAIVRAEVLLVLLATGKERDMAGIREQAKILLRHYPTKVDVDRWQMRDEKDINQ
jgi:hypothetical protein